MLQHDNRIHQEHVMEKIISHIAEEWFLSEPVLFACYCTHTLTSNTKMCVPMRTGRMKIEYNPVVMAGWSESRIEQRLRLEIIRILLGHPYQRQPYKATKAALGLASDITLIDSYEDASMLMLPPGLEFEGGKCFEEYYAIVTAYLEAMSRHMYSAIGEIEGLFDDGGGGISDDAESLPESPDYELGQKEAEAELWEEDQMSSEQICEVIEMAKHNNSWGSLPGNLVEQIIASCIVNLDYRRIISGFRASVLASTRHRTRMLPSRRYGFKYMGSKRDFCTRLLVAVDVSGSVSSRQVSQALSIINRFFRYGVERIDVIQFDAGIVGDVIPFKKAKSAIQIKGRGGTSFQEPIDFYCNGCYDGFIMITDGFAPAPELPKRIHGNILWMLYDSSTTPFDGQMDSSFDWIEKLPKNRYLILPPVA